MSIIYGPVPSRRLGFSLGVDIVPLKTCTLDCIYCQLGRTTSRTVRRKEFVSKRAVLKEVEGCLKNKKRIDYITFAGSGEPTLHSDIGDIINGIKKKTDIPVAVITNGTLLYRKAVRKALLEADLVVPSLDSASVRGFKRINRPDNNLAIGKVVEGIVSFSREYHGKIWLEVMLVKGYNDTGNEIEKLREIIKAIKPDKVHLNTVVRPPAEENACAVNNTKLSAIAAKLGKECDVICDLKPRNKRIQLDDLNKTIIEMVKRRPVTVEDISRSLGIEKAVVIKSVLILDKLGVVEGKKKNNRTFFKEAKNG